MANSMRLVVQVLLQFATIVSSLLVLKSVLHSLLTFNFLSMSTHIFLGLKNEISDRFHKPLRREFSLGHLRLLVASGLEFPQLQIDFYCRTLNVAIFGIGDQ